MRRTLCWLVVVAAVGCGGAAPFPELNRVTGVVKRAGRPVRGGAVQFVPTGGMGPFAVNSPVADNGTFTLITVRAVGGERKPGAPAGVYRVLYVPPESKTARPSSETPVELPKPVTVGGGENLLMLELAKK